MKSDTRSITSFVLDPYSRMAEKEFLFLFFLFWTHNEQNWKDICFTFTNEGMLLYLAVIQIKVQF